MHADRALEIASDINKQGSFTTTGGSQDHAILVDDDDEV